MRDQGTRVEVDWSSVRRSIERLHREMSNAGDVDPYWLRQVDDIIGLMNGETSDRDRQ